MPTTLPQSPDDFVTPSAISFRHRDDDAFEIRGEPHFYVHWAVQIWIVAVRIQPSRNINLSTIKEKLYRGNFSLWNTLRTMRLKAINRAAFLFIISNFML